MDNRGVCMEGSSSRVLSRLNTPVASPTEAQPIPGPSRQSMSTVQPGKVLVRHCCVAFAFLSRLAVFKSRRVRARHAPRSRFDGRTFLRCSTPSVPLCVPRGLCGELPPPSALPANVALGRAASAPRAAPSPAKLAQKVAWKTRPATCHNALAAKRAARTFFDNSIGFINGFRACAALIPCACAAGDRLKRNTYLRGARQVASPRRLPNALVRSP